MTKRSHINFVKRIILAQVIWGFCFIANAQKFIHPGISQNVNDLLRMKSLVLSGKQPYKAAFDKLKKDADEFLKTTPHTRVMRGPYGKPNIGGEDLRIASDMAYNNALIWYVTGDKKYALKSIEIINAWTNVLWDFDFNDAKLIAALTGSVWCNAAEILTNTSSGWHENDIQAFRKMLMTVYYPLLRFYFPTANGNWNGGIIQTILAISIFMDRSEIFNNAVDNFLHSTANGSVFKYIYPNGQCQESPRDQGHVQMGLGLFAGAAQIAFTQGVDFFTLGQNRIAKGFEFTARYMLGEEPHCYCIKSTSKRESIRDDYEYVYQHYHSIGVEVPWTKKIADSIRQNNSRSILTSVRAKSTFEKSNKLSHASIQYGIKGIVGATAIASDSNLLNAIIVNPGQSIQSALNLATNSHIVVKLKTGVHRIKESLKIPSNVTIVGEGVDTKIFLDPASGQRDVIVNESNDMHDVTIENLLIEVSDRLDVPSDPNSHRSRGGGYNRGGILFHALKEGQMRHIKLKNLTIRNATYNGVFISGADNVSIINCDLDENGGNAVPGQKLQHNLLLTHCRDILVKNSRLATSPFGSGLALDKCQNATISENEIARNGYYGVLLLECKNISVKENLIEANDRSGVMMEYLFHGNESILLDRNLLQFNAGWGIESYASKNLLARKNELYGNDSNVNQKMISINKKILIQ